MSLQDIQRLGFTADDASELNHTLYPSISLSFLLSRRPFVIRINKVQKQFAEMLAEMPGLLSLNLGEKMSALESASIARAMREGDNAFFAEISRSGSGVEAVKKVRVIKVTDVSRGVYPVMLNVSSQSVDTHIAALAPSLRSKMEKALNELQFRFASLTTETQTWLEEVCMS